MKRALRWMICAVAMSIVGASLPAIARPSKIALTKIDGDESDLGKAVMEALEDTELSIVSAKKVGRVSDQLGLDDKPSDRDVERLASELDVDAIIKGTFDRRLHRLRFTIFANGKKGKSFAIQFSNASSDKFRKLVRTTLVTRLAEVVPPASDAGADDDARSRPPSKKAKQDEGDAAADDSGKKSARTKAKGKQDKDSDDTADAAADDSGKKPAKTKAKTTARSKDSDDTADTAADDSGKKSARTKAKGKKDKDKDDTADAVADEGAKKPAKAKTKAKDSDATDAVADEGGKKPARSKTTSKAKDGDAADAVADEGPKKPARPKAKEADAVAAVTPSAEDASSEPPAGDDAPRTATKQVAAREEEEATPSARARLAPSTLGPVHSANLVAVRVDLGSSMSGRDLRFKTTAFANAPRPYQNTPVPGARFEGELYPFAFQDPSSLLAGLGVAGDFDQVVALTLHASSAMAVPLKTTERHYSFGLRYRIAFGHTPTSPTLTLGGGYGVRMFVVDRTGLMAGAPFDLPDVNYQLFDPGVAFRLPLGGKLAVTLGGRALLVRAVGQIQHADQYGNAKILGGAASAGLELILGNRVALRVAGEATQFNYTFDGTGVLATSRDGDPSSLDVRGATDRYYGGAATLAILY
jgi:hypothetical protein